jgi:hypothetical protein
VWLGGGRYQETQSRKRGTGEGGGHAPQILGEGPGASLQSPWELWKRGGGVGRGRLLAPERVPPGNRHALDPVRQSRTAFILDLLLRTPSNTKFLAFCFSSKA